MKKLLSIALFIFVLAACGNAKKAKHWDAVTISVEDMYISGEWKDYIVVEDGDYLLEDLNTGSGTFDYPKPRISLRLTLKQPFPGRMENPSETLRLDALSRGGAGLGKEFFIDSSSRDKFNDFVRGEPGISASITFAANYWKNDTWFSEVAGFDAKTREASVARTAPAETTVTGSPAAPITRDTGTDPLFNARTRARTGPRIVAVPELTGTVNIPDDMIVGATGVLTTYLLENPGVHSVVDYTRIAEAQKQLKFEAGDLSNPAKYAEIGRALNVDTIAVGTIAEGGKMLFVQTYTVSVQLIDIATLSVAGAFSESIMKTETANLRKPITNMRVRL